MSRVDNQRVWVLVDTGASSTVISKANNMTAENRYLVDVELVQDNGNPLPLMDQKFIETALGPLRVSHQVIVADIKDDAILGIDFLNEHDYKLDLASQLLTIQETTINMWNEGDKIHSCRVSLKHDSNIPT